MTKCLGEYKGSVPTSLVTEKRAVVGGLTPEIAQLQGKRYAVMQEPSKGDKLNDGVMKQLTGEDEVQANPKYKDPVSFIPQFKLVVCTNNLFDIKSTDDGTWRRIRLCEFNSKFVSNPSKNPNDHEFLIDSNIDVKLERWKEVFMSMLIDVAKDKQGDVDDCDAVLQASRNYRKEQDSLMEYTKERLIKKDDDILHSVGGKEKLDGLPYTMISKIGSLKHMVAIFQKEKNSKISWSKIMVINGQVYIYYAYNMTMTKIMIMITNMITNMIILIM